MSPFSQPVTNSSASPAVFLSPPGIIEAAFVKPQCSEVSPMATLDPWLKCPEAG